MHNRRLVPLLLVVAVAACQKPETPEQATARMQAESDLARTAIEAQNAVFMRHANAGQADSVAMLYTTDGELLPPDMPAAMGRDSIKARLAPMLAPGMVLALHVTGVAANGPMAVERGNWTIAVPAQGRTPAMNLGGKYLVHWHQVDGQWLLAQDIWNNDAPMAPPAPAARR